MEKITTFKDLKVWVKAHELVLKTYRITKSFPRDEQYVLLPQIRRSVVSVSSNIVEGFKRNYPLEKLRFYNIAQASLEEFKYQLLIAYDLKYVSNNDYELISDLASEVGRLLHYWIKSQK